MNQNGDIPILVYSTLDNDVADVNMSGATIEIR